LRIERVDLLEPAHELCAAFTVPGLVEAHAARAELRDHVGRRTLDQRAREQLTDGIGSLHGVEQLLHAIPAREVRWFLLGSRDGGGELVVVALGVVGHVRSSVERNSDWKSDYMWRSSMPERALVIVVIGNEAGAQLASEQRRLAVVGVGNVQTGPHLDIGAARLRGARSVRRSDAMRRLRKSLEVW
jgi:hypothetical protein